MGLTGAGIADEDDIPSCSDKLAGTTVIDDSLVNRGLEGKIKILDSLLSR